MCGCGGGILCGRGGDVVVVRSPEHLDHDGLLGILEHPHCIGVAQTCDVQTVHLEGTIIRYESGELDFIFIILWI